MSDNSYEADVHKHGSIYDRANHMGKSLPCVLYEAKSSFEITQVSGSIERLLGIGRESIIAGRSFWTEWLFNDDLPLIEANLQVLDTSDYVSFAHRMFNGSRLPIWVSHSIRKETFEDKVVLRGCLTPILNDNRIFALDQTLITRFVHKLGNHFQLLNLIVGSLRKSLPETREAEILFETLDKAAEMTRAFADCTQLSSWWSKIQLSEVLNAVMDSQREPFRAKGVLLLERYEKTLDDASLSGDPFLLEAAFTLVVADALDALQGGGAITLTAWIENRRATSAVAKLQLVRSQTDLSEGDPNGQPSCALNKEHDDLGISMAARVIEMHGGLFRPVRTECNGNAIEISLPIIFCDERSCA